MAIRLFITTLFAAAGLCAVEAAAFRSVNDAATPPRLKSSVSASTQGKMYIMSDLHYDPYFGTANAVGSCTSPSSPPFGTITCDGSYALIKNAMDDLFTQAASDSASIFLLLGDLPRHSLDAFANNNAAGSYYQQYKVPLQIAANVTNTIASMVVERVNMNNIMNGKTLNNGLPSSSSSLMDNAIAHPDILGAFGNNDCVPHYFEEKLNNPAALVNFTNAFLKNGLISSTEQKTWENCGYFSRTITANSANSPQNGPAVVLNINSVMYAPDSNVNNNGALADPCGQFAWMAAEVQKARANGSKVIIVGHVVPMVNKWVDSYIATYTTFLQQNNDVISAQFFSHTHMFTFVTLTNDDSTPPVFDLPSISPVDGNNPSYVAVTFSSTWQVNEIHHRYMSQDQSGNWVDGLVFGKDFGLPSPLTTSALYNYAQTLLPLDKKDGQWQQFLSLYEGGFPSATMDNTNKEKTKKVCKMITRNYADYEACKGK